MKRTPEQIARMVAGRTDPLDVRLYGRIDRTGDCHLWTGTIKKQDGYGVIWYEGKLWRVHRLVWMLAGRELPVWPNVLDHYECRVRTCCNLDHLRVTTQTVNSLESDSPLARNKRKTHCKQGHLLTGNNVRIVKSIGPRGSPCTGRVCLKCYGPGGIMKPAALKRAAQA